MQVSENDNRAYEIKTSLTIMIHDRCTSTYGTVQKISNFLTQAHKIDMIQNETSCMRLIAHAIDRRITEFVPLNYSLAPVRYLGRAHAGGHGHRRRWEGERRRAASRGPTTAATGAS
jgi:hypothetical protein